MSKYKVGDKVLIEGKIIESSSINFPRVEFRDGSIVVFRNDFLDAFGISKTKTYEDGLNDAWELARKIENKLDIPTARSIFDSYRIADILDNFTPQEALAKLEAYEKGQEEIKVGDVVYADDEPDSFGVVTYMDSERLYITWDDGSSGKEFDWSDIHKTGRHIDIEHLLEQIRGNE